MRTDTQS